MQTAFLFTRTFNYSIIVSTTVSYTSHEVLKYRLFNDFHTHFIQYGGRTDRLDNLPYRPRSSREKLNVRFSGSDLHQFHERVISLIPWILSYWSIRRITMDTKFESAQNWHYYDIEYYVSIVSTMILSELS